MEAPGIEPDTGQGECTIQHDNTSIGTDAEPRNVPTGAPKCTIVQDAVTQSSEAYELSNVVETALAKALLLAAEAARWDVVMQIAAELERRSAARAQGTSSAPERLSFSSSVSSGSVPARRADSKMK